MYRTSLFDLHPALSTQSGVPLVIRFEKADAEKIPLETAAYRIAEDIRDYRQLGGEEGH